ncbi:hypothetical protein FCH28_21840 [Streptomyces piniterrae]|uniref:Alanine-rich protein n=1 Tax=Streptomyces piniterrae TaxID=2571125 RepID=A0A4V5MJY4_9ACTN|nr:hypothetical protein [Streptomyces piniterrae]TJZ51138.1 hypothetical protein FCH28_21840 [Streptomyces piniterrae]
MRTAAFLYPWDVVGDPDAAGRVADLGVHQVTLASAYHSTRALTPRHPRHRIVTARHSAVLYPPDAARWAGRALRPYAQDWVEGEDPFGAAARALADGGLEVHTWVVLAHNSRLGAEHPSAVVRNAYGDPYPWAPCIARPEVRDYLVRLAAEAAVRPGARGTELESCGWYGLAHPHGHDKIGGVPLSGAAQYLMSLCFCSVCAEGYAQLGLPGGELRHRVVRALEPLWGAAADRPKDRAVEWGAASELLGADIAEVVRGWRDRAARTLQRAAVRAVRDAAGGEFRVLLHADPAAHRCGANAGVDPADVLSHADGVVVPCTGDDAARADALGPFADRGRDHGATVAANLTVVSGLGGSPGTLAADAAHAASLGANALRLYHAGLASDRDLTAVRAALRDTGGSTAR